MTETYPTPAEGWTCFHCGENFPGNMAGHNAALLHFGKSIHDEPKCQITAYRLRAIEEQLRRYREEDTDLHREIHSLKSDHATALRREEEKGYALGLKDYEALSQDRERTQAACRVVTEKAEKLAELLRQAMVMAEFGDINADMEDDGVGWKQWYMDTLAILGPQANPEAKS